MWNPWKPFPHHWQVKINAQEHCRPENLIWIFFLATAAQPFHLHFINVVAYTYLSYVGGSIQISGHEYSTSPLQTELGRLPLLRTMQLGLSQWMAIIFNRLVYLLIMVKAKFVVSVLFRSMPVHCVRYLIPKTYGPDFCTGRKKRDQSKWVNG